VEGVLEALTSKVAASEVARSHACAVVFISSLPLDLQAVAVQVGSYAVAGCMRMAWCVCVCGGGGSERVLGVVKLCANVVVVGWWMRGSESMCCSNG
jgi:hypothetical protein